MAVRQRMCSRLRASSYNHDEKLTQNGKSAIYIGGHTAKDDYENY